MSEVPLYPGLCRVSRFGTGVWGVRDPVSVPCFGFLVSGFGFRISGFGRAPADALAAARVELTPLAARHRAHLVVEGV